MVARLARRRRSRPGAESDRSPDGQMTLLEHLGELRHRIMVSIVALGLGAAVGFFLYHPVLRHLVEPYCDLKRSKGLSGTCQLVVTDPLESMSLRLKISTYLGFLMASPVILFQLWRFITPGLYAREKRFAVPFVASSVFLFLLGAGLALATFPKALEFFAAFGGEELELLYGPSKYLGLLILTMVAFGLAFEFPIVLIFLQMAGIVTWRKLWSWNRPAMVVIVVAAAVITPSGDPVTLLAMALPMVLFYEASILVGRFVLRKP